MLRWFRHPPLAHVAQIYPDVEENKIYYGQSLYKSGSYAEALKARP